MGLATNRSEIKVDWLSFVYMPYGIPEYENSDLTAYDFMRLNVPEVNRIIDDNDNTQLSGGNGHYHFSIIWSTGMRIFFDDSRNNMGVYFSVNSDSLYDFFQVILDKTEFTVVDCLMWVKNNHFRISRIDICFDDYSKTYAPGFYADMYSWGLMSTRFRSCGRTKVIKAETVYFGQRSNGKYVRIYDKSAESKGEVDSIRYEVELKQNMARAFCDYYIVNSDKFNFGSWWINNIFKVLDEGDKDTYGQHKSRAAMQEDWAKFVKDCFNEKIEFHKLKITPGTKPVSCEKALKFMAVSVAPLINSLSEFYGRENIMFLLESVVKKSSKHKQYKADYEKHQTVDPDESLLEICNEFIFDISSGEIST